MCVLLATYGLALFLVFILKPVRTGCHDYLVALLFTEAKFGEHTAFVVGIFLAPAAVALPLARDQFIRRQIGEIIERLDPRLAKRDQHCLGEMRHVGKRILDAKRDQRVGNL